MFTVNFPVLIRVKTGIGDVYVFWTRLEEIKVLEAAEFEKKSSTYPIFPCDGDIGVVVTPLGEILWTVDVSKVNEVVKNGSNATVTLTFGLPESLKATVQKTLEGSLQIQEQKE